MDDAARTPRRAFQRRLMAFVHGQPNLAGCALALLGPLLLAAGVIHAGWLPITAGLYAAGWLLGRGLPDGGRAGPAEGEAADAPLVTDRGRMDLSLEQALARLDALIEATHRQLSPEMNAALAGIRTSVCEMLPRLAGASGADLFTVRETLLRYLPETLANYLALPPALRATRILADGQTAHQLLTGQLTLLDASMREVAASVAAADVQALLANGRFLEMKFRGADLLS